jgi:hypothetical protein
VREEEETEALETVMHPSDHEDDDAEYYREALGEAPPTGRRMDGRCIYRGLHAKRLPRSNRNPTHISTTVRLFRTRP